MADELMSGGAPTSGQEPTAGGASAPTTPRGQGPATVPQAGDAGTAERSGTDGGHRSPSDEQSNAQDGMTEAQLRAALKKANAEAAAYRKKANEYDERLKQDELAKLTEDERKQARIAELEAQLAQRETEAQERFIRSETRFAARELGVNPDRAWQLIDYSAITFNDDGAPTNILELMKQALADLGLAPAPASAPAAGQSLPAGQPGVVARATPALPALGATNPPRSGATSGQPFVRSVHDIQWKRG